MALLEYDFIVEHKPGRLNTNADVLSRIITQTEEVEVCVRRIDGGGAENYYEDITPITSVIWDETTISNYQHRDREIRKIIESEKTTDNSSFYLGKDKILYKKRESHERHDKIVAPKNMHKKIFYLYHDTPLSGHVGFKKM